MNVSKDQISKIASSVGLDYARLMAFIATESGGKAFNDDGKIVIQFEPTWFHRYLEQFKVNHTYSSTVINDRKEYVITANGKTLTNGVEGQSEEWPAFNIAFSIHPQAALLSTSIGLMQVMGFNYAKSGYSSVNEMWDSFKASEANQVQGAANFIKNTPILLQALKNKDWKSAAKYYNGENYAAGRYDVKLENNYKKYS